MVTTNSNKKHTASAINAASGLSSTSKLNQKIISTNNMPIKNDLKRWHNSIVSEMTCTNKIHNELLKMNELICPFCNKKMIEIDNIKVVDSCCGDQDIEIIDGMNTCINCGLIHGYEYVTEYFNFYGKMHLIRRKSIYNRKYHIDNVLDSISINNNIQLTHYQRKQIHKALIVIDSVSHKVENGRKRIISIRYIITQLFKMFGLPYKDINVTKSKRTLKYYEQYWEKVQSLLGDKIHM